MPTYVYRFIDSGKIIEVQQAFSDEPFTTMADPADGTIQAVKKVFTPVGVSFKGDGFYKTDSRTKSSSTSATATATSAAGSESTSNGDSAAKSDSVSSPDTSSSPASTPASSPPASTPAQATTGTPAAKVTP